MVPGGLAAKAVGKGVKVADKVFKALPIIKEDFENYLKDLQKIEKQNGKKETRAD